MLRAQGSDDIVRRNFMVLAFSFAQRCDRGVLFGVATLSCYRFLLDARVDLNEHSRGDDGHGSFLSPYLYYISIYIHNGLQMIRVVCRGHTEIYIRLVVTAYHGYSRRASAWLPIY